MQIAYQKAKMLQSLVNQFYELSLLETNNQESFYSKVNITELMTDTLLSFTPEFEDKNLKPVFKDSENKYIVVTDKTKIRRILQNLFSNAIRYSIGDITIVFTSNTDTFQITISNPVENAKNIAVDKIFNRFYTYNQNNSIGTGLGLHIVKKLADEIGVSISANVGEGMIHFVLDFPIEKAVTSPMLAEIESENGQVNNNLRGAK